MIVMASQTGVAQPRCRVCGADFAADTLCEMIARPWKSPILTCISGRCPVEATEDGLAWADNIP